MQMVYYIFINKETHSYFINRAQKPLVGVRHHFHRAGNPSRKDYDSKFYQDIRKYGYEGFIIRYSLERPVWATVRAHYVECDLSLEEMLAGIEEFEPKIGNTAYKETYMP